MISSNNRIIDIVLENSNNRISNTNRLNLRLYDSIIRK